MKITVNDTADVVIKHPGTGDELVLEDGSKVMVTVYTPQSPQFKKARNKLADARAKSKKTLSAQEIQDQLINLVCAAVHKLHNFDKLDLNNKGLGYITKETLPEILAEHDWLKEQINDATGNMELFIETASEKPKKS